MFFECKHCGRMVKSSVVKLTCEACKTLDEEIYEKIKDYLEYHPFANAIEVSQAVGIRSKLVLKYVDEGKLRVVDGHFSN